MRALCAIKVATSVAVGSEPPPGLQQTWAHGFGGKWTLNAPMELTQENLKRIDPSLSREERELELMDRMQTLSALLGRVDDALAAAPGTNWYGK